MNKTTLTIGIPAYNEENNIEQLLLTLLSQDYSPIELVSIVVSSDGSTDKTVSIVRKIKDRRLLLIDNKNRKGIARGLNQILKRSGTDITVLLDADIYIKDKKFIKKLIAPILDNDYDLTSSSIKDYGSDTFTSKMLSHSMSVKDALFSNFKSGENIYHCHGLARAFSFRFAKKAKFPVSVGNDMYCYLQCIESKFKFKYVSNAFVYYKLPKNLTDHKKQNNRFMASSQLMKKYFDIYLVDREIKIPLYVYVKSFYKIFILSVTKPVLSISYVFLTIYLYLTKKEKTTYAQAWDIAQSSK